MLTGRTSARGVRQFGMALSPGDQTIAAGTSAHIIVWDPITNDSDGGLEYWGVTGAAQTLAMTIDGSPFNDIFYPDENATYDVQVACYFTGNAADNGKAATLRWSGNDSRVMAEGVMRAGRIDFQFSGVDHTYLGDGSNGYMTFYVDTRLLANSIDLINMDLIIWKR